MVTGDQVPTAKAIANNVNIISDPDMEYGTIMKRENLSPDEALKKCQSMVINGNDLRYKLEEKESDDEDYGDFL